MSQRPQKSAQQFVQVYLPPILTLILFLLCWQYGALVFEIPHYLLPKPTDIVRVAVENWEHLTQSVFTTISEAVIGFVLSAVFGVGAAILMASSKVLERSLYPYAILLQTIPIVAIAPIIVIWFGAGLNAIVIIAFIIGFFPMVSNTLIGLQSVDHNMLNLFQLYNASKWQTMWRLRVPAAMPYIMAGLKISCSLAVIGAIVGEFIAGIGGGQGGLGYAITVAAARVQTPYLFACGLAASVLGVVFYLLVNALSKAVLGSWHDLEIKREN